MTDNGSCYRSRDFAAALGEIKHVWTRPYRPQTNGKVERFNRTLATEWAYAATYLSDEARAAEYPAWLHHYNHHRPHTGIGGQTPSATRSQRHRELQLVAKMRNGGSACTSTNRLYIHRSLHDEFVARLRAGLAAYSTGPGLDRSNRLWLLGVSRRAGQGRRPR
jgi:hypothetical protein